MENSNGEALLLQILENQSKMQADILGMKSDITEMQVHISGMKLDITEMQADISRMKSDTTEMQGDISGMRLDITEKQVDILGLKADITEIKGKINSVYNQTADLTEFLTETKDNFTSINKDVKFIKHKPHKTEEDVFDIKRPIKIVK